MPANHHIDHKNKLIVTRWEGIARDFELINAFKKYQQEIQNHPDHMDYNEILDLRTISSNQVTIDGIRNIALIASQTDRDESNRKLAFIVDSNLAYGLARMYETYRKFGRHGDKKIRVFKNEKNAFEWVQQ